MNNESKQTLISILERLDDVEKRLSALELDHQPIQPIDYPKPHNFDWQKFVMTDNTTFVEKN